MQVEKFHNKKFNDRNHLVTDECGLKEAVVSKIKKSKWLGHNEIMKDERWYK